MSPPEGYRRGPSHDAVRKAPPDFDNPACRGLPIDMFFPSDAEAHAPQMFRALDAKRVCRGCEHRQDCLDYALSFGRIPGVWGGTTQKDRDLIKARRIREAREARDAEA